jgi:uncharacterized protein YndB with AHSA1/START domain
MSEVIDVAPETERELVLARIIDAPRAAVFRCWTEPELMAQWFTPAPWKTVSAEMELRPGGRSLMVMESPEGEQFPNAGVVLEVIPGEKLVFTDAYTEDWRPSEKPFFTAVLTFEDAGDGRTRYVARARHWTAEDMKRHEEMGFHTGWGICADQLEALARTL